MAWIRTFRPPGVFLALPAALLPAFLLLACAPGGRQATPPLNVLLYVVDTLRADQLRCYGGKRPISPRLDALARESVLFENAVASSPWTRPSIVSLFSGLTPRRHGVHERLDRLPAELAILPSLLQRNGYRTAAFVSSAVITAHFGFDRGFDVFRQEVKEAIEAKRPTSSWIDEQAFDWLARRDRGRPFFLYLHALDPHMPYTPPEPWRRRFAPRVDRAAGSVEHVVALRDGRLSPTAREAEDLLALYDAEVAANDEAFGHLADRLRAAGLWDSTLVIFVSDHGEEFFDHGGWEHGATLYQELLHVPLIVKLPRGKAAGRRIAETVRQIDVLPTVLDLLGTAAPPELEGRSLLPLLAEPAATAAVSRRPAPAFSSLDLDGRRMESILLGRWKLIRTATHDRLPVGSELYDLAADPAERTNRAAAEPAVAAALGALLRQADREARRPAPLGQAPPDPEIERQLRALGYGVRASPGG
jgi:arylsulfatase A-like enzyme